MTSTHAAACQLYSSFWQAHGGQVPGDAQQAVCMTTNSTAPACDQWAPFQTAQSSMASAQDEDDKAEAMRSLSFLFNAFIMMQVRWWTRAPGDRRDRSRHRPVPVR